MNNKGIPAVTTHTAVKTPTYIANLRCALTGVIVRIRSATASFERPMLKISNGAEI